MVAVCYHPLIGYDFVMSDTMFSKTDTFIHRIGNKYVEIFFVGSKQIPHHLQVVGHLVVLYKLINPFKRSRYQSILPG